MEMIGTHLEENTGVNCSSNLHERDSMDRYSPTSPTENSPVGSPLPKRASPRNAYSPTNPTDDVDDLEDHIFRTERIDADESSAPGDNEHDGDMDNTARESSSNFLATDDNSSPSDDDSDCDSENRLVINDQEEVEEERDDQKKEVKEDRDSQRKEAEEEKDDLRKEAEEERDDLKNEAEEESDDPKHEAEEEKDDQKKGVEEDRDDQRNEIEEELKNYELSQGPDDSSDENSQVLEDSNVQNSQTLEASNSENSQTHEAGFLEKIGNSEGTESDSHNVNPQDSDCRKEAQQTEDFGEEQKDGEDYMSSFNVQSIPLPEEPEKNHSTLRRNTSDVLQLSADNDLETRPSDVDTRKSSRDDSSSDESEDSLDKKEVSSSSSTSSSDQSPEYDRSPESPSSPEDQSCHADGDNKNQIESDKEESSGEIIDDDNSADEDNFRSHQEKSNKGRESAGASPNNENSNSRGIEDGIDIMEMSVDLDDKDYSSEPRITGFESAPKGSPALGVTRVIQRINVDNEGRAEGDSRTVQAGEDDSDDDVQIIECPPQEPIDTLIVDDDDDDDVVPCNSGGARKTLSEMPRTHRSKKEKNS